MKRLLISILFCFVLTACSNSPETTYEIRTYTHSEDEIDLLDKINSYRSDEGQSQLTIVEHASALCADHNDYMISKSIINHDYFYSRSCSIISVCKAIHVGECVAYNYQTNASVLSAWKTSACHDTILRSNFTRIGISIRKNSSQQKVYTIILFD